MVGAYEIQAAWVALTKGESLRAHYGLNSDETEFWDIHATGTIACGLDDRGPTALGANCETVQKFATDSSEAWWSFLDERDVTRNRSPCLPRGVPTR